MRNLSQALLITLSLALFACGSEPVAPVVEAPVVEAVAPAAPTPAPILDATRAYLESTAKPVMTADKVKEALAAGDTSMVVFDVRDAQEHFAAGHIQGATFIPFADWAKPETLAKLPPKEEEKTIVLTCYSGHKGAILAMYLRQLGYKAHALKFGMYGWTSDEAVIGKTPYCKMPAHEDFPVVTEPTVAAGGHTAPPFAETGTPEEVIRAAGTRVIANLGKPVMTAEDLNAAITAGQAPGFIVDVREADLYAKGHIAGAINVPMAGFAKPESLAMLPTDQKLILVCQSGHQASQAVFLLRQLGYDAVALMGGMMTWQHTTSNFQCTAAEPTVTQ